MSLLEKINEIEKEISRTQKNKATEHHLGGLRARLNKYRKQLQQAQEAHGDDAAAEEMALPDETVAQASAKNSKSKGPKSKPAPTKNTKKKPPTTKKPAPTVDPSSSSDPTTSSDSDTPPEPSRNRFLALPSDSDSEASDPTNILSPASCDEPHHEEVSDAPDTVKTKKRTKKKKKLGGKEKELEQMTGEELLEMYAAQNEGTAAGVVVEGARKRRGSEGGISAKLLNYRYEFQKTVGVNALFMQATAPDLAPGGRTRGERAGGGRAVRGVQYLFVQPPANFPERDAKDVIDRYLHVEDDPVHPGWMVFKRSRRYKDLQHDFLLMVYTNQDHVIQDILHQMPFHSDALLLMASIHERDDNYASARQAIEHTIFGFQSCLDHRLRNHPETHRLSYRYPANRSYCVALYKHIALTVPRFPKTALELGKYLFNLSPKDDPLAVILMMDFLALKAKDYAYLLAFTDTLKEIKNLDLLPNFAFSVPLAYYLRSRQSEKNADDGVDEEMAENLLMEGILRFPGMIQVLFAKMDVPLERAVSNCSLFRAAQNESSEGLDLLQALYVRRCAAFWKENDVLLWLQNVLAKVVEMVQYDEPEWGERRQQYTDLRSRSYRGTPSNIWRHVLLMNIPENERVFQMRLPTDGNNFIFPFDPIPPSNSLERDECDSHAFSQPAGRERRRTEPAAPPGPEEAAAPGAVQQIVAATRMFLQTLWPSAEEVNAAAQTVELLPGMPARGGDVVQGAAINDNDEMIDADKEDGLRGYLDRLGVLYDMYTGGEQAKGSSSAVPQDVEVTDGDDEDTRGSAE